MEPTGIWIDETTDVSRSFTTTSASASAISDKVECRLDINNQKETLYSDMNMSKWGFPPYFFQTVDTQKVSVKSLPTAENQNQSILGVKRQRQEDTERADQINTQKKIGSQDEPEENEIQSNSKYLRLGGIDEHEIFEKQKLCNSCSSCNLMNSKETFENIFQNYLKYYAELKDLEKEQSRINKKIDSVFSIILENQEFISKSLNEIIKETEYNKGTTFKKPFPIKKTL